MVGHIQARVSALACAAPECDRFVATFAVSGTQPMLALVGGGLNAVMLGALIVALLSLV